MKKYILMLLMLSACCSNDDNDCTEEELAAKTAQRQYWHEKETKPELVSVVNGIKLYRIWTIEPSSKLENHWTYFTAPCGDVSAELSWEEMHGKVTEQIHQQINTAGSGCAK